MAAPITGFRDQSELDDFSCCLAIKERDDRWLSSTKLLSDCWLATCFGHFQPELSSQH